MKLRVLSCYTLACSLAFVASQGASGAGSADSASDIPHLRKQGTATQMIVDGKPFLMLAGELANNSATSLDYMKPVWPRLVDSKLNTVLAGVSWGQLEPAEGKFDFTIVDGVIQEARNHNLHLALLWFASWKNGMSSYPPPWVKKDFERFPRAQIAEGAAPWPVLTISDVPRVKVTGNLSIELLSPLSEANREADARAFAALMRHVKAVDGNKHTVILIQVENEVGMQGDSRDRSPAAAQAFAGPVPKELMDYLQQHKATLIPEFRKVWAAAGFKTSGTWEEVFGKGLTADEIFMAWHFARYVGRVAEAGKAEYPIPMYVNAALPRTSAIGEAAVTGREPGVTGYFAIGGPMDDVMDIWRAGGPQVDILSPDAYNDFADWCAKNDRSGNPLFIPESRGGAEGAARMLYAFGRHNAIGYSPMGIDSPGNTGADLTTAYDQVTQLAPLISAHQGDGTMSAVLLRGPADSPQKVRVGDYTLEVSFISPRRIAGEPPPSQGNRPAAVALFIAAGPDEYFAVGSGLTVSFSPNTPGPPLAGLATVEEGAFVKGRWVAGRRLEGDDSDEGQFLMLGSKKGIQHFTLYRYR